MVYISFHASQLLKKLFLTPGLYKNRMKDLVWCAGHSLYSKSPIYEQVLF